MQCSTSKNKKKVKNGEDVIFDSSHVGKKYTLPEGVGSEEDGHFFTVSKIAKIDKVKYAIKEVDILVKMAGKYLVFTNSSMIYDNEESACVNKSAMVYGTTSTEMREFIFLADRDPHVK